jgi:hypothetical protein
VKRIAFQSAMRQRHAEPLGIRAQSRKRVYSHYALQQAVLSWNDGTALLPGGLAPQLRSRKAAARAAAATRAARASVRVIHKANKAGLGKGEP